MARIKKMEEDEKRKKVEFRKKVRNISEVQSLLVLHRFNGVDRHVFAVQMEKEVSDFIQDSSQQKRKYNPMGKIERSIL